MNGYPPHFQDYPPYPPPAAQYHPELLPAQPPYGRHDSPAGDSNDAAMLAFVNHSASGSGSGGSDPGVAVREDELSGYATSNPPSATTTTFPSSVHRLHGASSNPYVARNRTVVGSRPSDPVANVDPQHQRNLLLSFFKDSPSSSGRQDVPDPLHPTAKWANPYEQFDPNLIVDHIGNAALHWAVSLSRPNLVAFLLSRGADPHRGNHNGETALVRCILATNVFDAQSLSTLLTLADGAIGSTLRTVDSQHRSVLHHIALVAGIKGRAGAARYYMETILEYVARYELSGRSAGEGFRSLVDVQDTSGDSALNIAARVGNKALVRLLVDVGADRSLRNNLGLRAEDFGIEEESLKVTAADDAVAALRSSPAKPVQQSKDVFADMTRAIEGLQSSFDSEMKAKDAVLSAASSQLIDTTRDLAAERKQAQTLELKMWELDQVGQRIKNLEKALEQENGFDWTGRASLPSDTKAGPSFVSRPRSSSVAPPTFSGPDPTVASDLNADPGKEIYEMRKITWWQKRVHELLKERISSVKEDSSEKELLYTKVIALCSGVPAEMVEEMLDKLVVAVESDGGTLDGAKINGLAHKAREQPA